MMTCTIPNTTEQNSKMASRTQAAADVDARLIDRIQARDAAALAEIFDRYGRLVYTVIDPNSAIADVPSNYLTITCELKERNARASTLVITQGDFAAVENGENRYKDSISGGDSIMVAIKKVAEEHYRSITGTK